MFEELKTIKSGKNEVRQFALAVAVVLLVISGVLYLNTRYVSLFLAYGALGLLVLGIVCPVLLTPLQRAWMSIAVCIGWAVTHLILIIVFYGVVFPTSLIARLCRKKFLDVMFKKPNDIKSYWIKRDASCEIERKRYEQQF